MEEKKTRKLFLLIFAFAFLFRLFLAIRTQVIVPDGLLYIKMAKSIDSGDLRSIGEYGFYNLYPFIVALFHKVIPDWEMAGRFVSVLFGTIATIPLFFIVKRTISSSVALLVSFFFAVHPRFIEYSSEVLREPLFWCLLLFALWAALEGIERNRWYLFVLSGLFAGLSMLTRFDGASIFPIVAGWLIVYYVKERISLRKGISFLIVLFVSVPVLLFPMLYMVKRQVGAWEFGHAGTKLPSLIAQEGNGQGTEQNGPAATGRTVSGFDELAQRHRPVIYLAELIYKFLRSMGVMFLILMFFGIFFRKAFPNLSGEIIIMIWLGVFVCADFFYLERTSYLSTRHALLVALPAFVWSGIGFLQLQARLMRIRCISHRASLIMVLIILFVNIPMAISGADDKYELKLIGRFLKENGYSQYSFVSQQSLLRAGFYADTSFIPISHGDTLKEIVCKMNDNKARFLIIDGNTIDTAIPGLERDIKRSGLFDVVSLPGIDRYKEYDVTVYKLKGGGR